MLRFAVLLSVPLVHGFAPDFDGESESAVCAPKDSDPCSDPMWPCSGSTATGPIGGRSCCPGTKVDWVHSHYVCVADVPCMEEGLDPCSDPLYPCTGADAAPIGGRPCCPGTRTQLVGTGPNTHWMCAKTQLVCMAATNTDSWAFEAPPGEHPSCHSSLGGVNDLGTNPQMCEGDSSSVRLELNPSVGAECLQAKAPNCKFNMHQFNSLDYDVNVDGCLGVWASPMWMAPDIWQGPGSGEIDTTEFCPRNAIYLNFAGDGHPVVTDFSIHDSSFHVTTRKDSVGMITIRACSLGEAAENGGQCIAPSYPNCAECLKGGKSYACYCNDNTSPPHIYGSNGCANGKNCIFMLVSDVWNGIWGDNGYKNCMREVPEIGLAHGKPNMNTNCKISVERVRIQGPTLTGKCAVFNAH